MRKAMWWKAASVACGLVLVTAATALPYEEFLRERAAIRAREDAAITGGGGGRSRDDIRRESDELVFAAFDDFLREQALAGVGLVATPTLGGEYAVAHVPDGTVAPLRFQFMDTATRALTGLAGLRAAGVARVDYTVNRDPARVDANGIALYDLFVGSSTDLDSLFSIAYVPRGFEDDVFATPYDAAGRAIVFAGLGGNVATGVVVDIFAVDEPAVTALLAAGLAALVRRAGRGPDARARVGAASRQRRY